VKLLPAALGLRPFCEFLGPSAIVGLWLIYQRQAKGFGHLVKALVNTCHVHVSAREKLFNGQPFIRNFGVKRKGKPFHPHPFFADKTFSTHRTEITPWSGVVGEDF
jgi:hypothetical protein